MNSFILNNIVNNEIQNFKNYYFKHLIIDDDNNTLIKQIYKKLNNRILKFLYEINRNPNYFNIHNKKNKEKVIIKIIDTGFILHNNTYYFNINLCIEYLNYNNTKSNKIINYLPLPNDINNLIQDFVSYQYIKLFLNIQIDCNNYPFRPHRIKLNKIESNLYKSNLTNSQLLNFYKDICESHSYIYNDDWSPAITLESEILDLITKLNFELFI